MSNDTTIVTLTVACVNGKCKCTILRHPICPLQALRSTLVSKFLAFQVLKLICTRAGAYQPAADAVLSPVLCWRRCRGRRALPRRARARCSCMCAAGGCAAQASITEHGVRRWQ